ncbi:hypothetical protein RCH10_002068 [Variovorax sp. GrIS 2.14]|uniref:hypothetical protein n=1 Tax=Variovorax sp. GrIS 2.14 TaxID=3071709 RepID=UPI0038F779EF
MTEEDRIAAAARLHVALRRKTGRVTDTEWMSVNVEYATAIVRIARAHATATSDLDLAAIATGLEFAMAPLALEARVKAAAAKAGLAPVISKGAPRYVGGLR